MKKITIVILLLITISGCAKTTRLIPYRDGEKWGFCNQKKEIIIPCIYESAKPFNNGLADIELDKKHGLINEKGEIVVPIEHMSLSISGDFIIVDNNYEFSDEGKGVLDLTGKVIVPIKHGVVEGPKEGVFIVDEGFYYHDSNIGAYDIEGNLIIHYQYDNIEPFQEGFAVYNQDGQYGYLNKQGEIAFDAKFEDAKSFSEGLAVVRLDGKECVINQKGEVVISGNFESIGNWDGDFSCGLAAVTKKGDDENNTGFINKNGELVIPYQFESVYAFKKGYSVVRKNALQGLIDTEGEFILPCEYNSIQVQNDDVIIVEKGEYYWEDNEGIYNNLAEKILPLEYKISDFNNGLAPIGKDGKFGYINEKAEIVIPIKYDSVDDFLYDWAKVSLDGKTGCYR